MKEENDNAGKNAEEKAASGKKNNENALITKESIGAVGALFSALAFLILATRSLIFGDVGMAVNSFLLGVFGYGAYFFVPLIFILSVAAFIGKRIFKNKPAAVFSVISLFIILLIVHGVVTASWQREGYFSACFTAAEGGVKTCSPAGWLGGLLVGALFAVSGKAGTFVILAMALVCFFALTARTVSGRSVIGAAISKIKSKKATKTEVKSAENTQVNPNGDFTEAAAATANPSSAAYGMMRKITAGRTMLPAPAIQRLIIIRTTIMRRAHTIIAARTAIAQAAVSLPETERFPHTKSGTNMGFPRITSVSAPALLCRKTFPIARRISAVILRRIPITALPARALTGSRRILRFKRPILSRRSVLPITATTRRGRRTTARNPYQPAEISFTAATPWKASVTI